jgi:hypothetical protein
MSTLTLAIDALKSNKIRTLATRVTSGVRVISGNKTEEEGADQEGVAGWIVKAFNLVNKAGAGVAGFLLNIIGGGIGWTFTALMNQIQQGARFLWNFNWNATNEELDAQYAVYMNMLAGQLGGTLGNAVGWAVCGAGPGLIMMKFNKLLAVRILKEVGEDALDELVANFRVLVQQAIQFALRQTIITTYKSSRRLLRDFLTNPDGMGKKIADTLGLDQAKIVEWGEKGNKPWSFAKQVDDWVESIENPILENFTEEFIEEFFDACSEAFYVVANAADQYMLEQKLNKAGIFGDEELVEIQPNRDNEAEKIIIAGPQELIKPAIVQTLTHHQLLHERNIGNFMGETVESLANREYTNIILRLIYSSSPHSKQNPTTVTLHNADRAKLDWLEIKTAMGGANGYMWGPRQITATLDDETYIRIWADAEGEGLDRVTALSRFVKGTILTVNGLHEMKEGKRKEYDTMYKTPRRQYPYEMLVINPVQILNEENGKATKKGIYKDRQAIIPLWTDTKPDDYDTKIADLFATPGQNTI